MAERLAFLSKSIGGHNGAGHSAFDVLNALLEINFGIIIGCERIPTNYGKYQHKLLLPIVWQCTANVHKLSTNKNHNFKLIFKSVSHLKKKWRQLKFFGVRHTVVDSLGSHEILEYLELEDKVDRTIIIRESPAFFTQGYSHKTLSWAIKVLQGYQNYIFVSKKCKQNWLEYGLDTTKKAFYIPNSCREDLVVKLKRESLKAIRKALLIPEDCFLVVCIASIQPRKGQDLIVEAYNKLKEKIPSMQIYLIGPNITRWGKKLEIDARKLDKSDHLKFIGRKTNALAYAYAADAVLLPSHAEALPRTILEAMAMQKPIVASNVDGIPELVEHEKSGLLFEDKDIEGMIANIVRIAEDEAFADALSKAALNKYHAFFTRQHQSSRLKKALKEIVEAKG